MLTTTQEIKRLESLLNGETVDGLKLGDAGLNYEWVIKAIANRREIQQSRKEKRDARIGK